MCNYSLDWNETGMNEEDTFLLDLACFQELVIRRCTLDGYHEERVASSATGRKARKLYDQTMFSVSRNPDI